MKTTRNRAINAPLKRALILAATLAGAAWTGGAAADGPPKIVAIGEAARTAVATERDRRFDLEAYGDRFKLAIKAIGQEAEKPRWGWEPCDGDEDVHVASKE